MTPGSLPGCSLARIPVGSLLPTDLLQADATCVGAAAPNRHHGTTTPPPMRSELAVNGRIDARIWLLRL